MHNFFLTKPWQKEKENDINKKKYMKKTKLVKLKFSTAVQSSIFELPLYIWMWVFSYLYLLICVF